MERLRVASPAGFLYFRCAGELGGIGDSARVREYGLLQILEGDLQKRSNAHHLMEGRSPHAAELPTLDRARADADDLAELRTRVARRLTALLQESSKSCLLKSQRRTNPAAVDRPLSQHIPSDLRTRHSSESTETGTV